MSMSTVQKSLAFKLETLFAMTFGERRKCPTMRQIVESLERRLFLSASTAPATQHIRWNGLDTEVMPGRWVVQMDNTPGGIRKQVDRANALLSAVDATFSVGHQLGAQGTFVINVPATRDPALTAKALKRVPGLVSAEPDFIYHFDATTPNDPSFAQLWGLNNTGQSGGTAGVDIKAPQAWDISTGNANTVVATIDTGADYNHPDLAPNIWTNPGEIAGNSIDDDGNGFVDDIHGWDFASGDNDPMDQQGHGTHVAGTIGARGNNNTGVTGVNWNVKIMPMRIGGANPSDPTVNSSAAVSAINYVTMMRNRGVGVRVTNNSWGGAGFSNALYSAMQTSGNSGIINVCAAGNGDASGVGINMDPVDAQRNYPAAFDLNNVISVANITRTGSLNSSSNYGLTTVDLGAPGTNIVSTYPVAQGSYATLTGTSMASPHVAGAVAFLFGLSPTASYQTIKSSILSNTDATASLSGKSVTGGRLNLYRAAVPFAKIPDMANASDSGASNSDNYTNDKTPTFTGNALANVAVQLFANGTQVGSGTADAAGNYTITTSALADNSYDITANWTGATSQTGPLGITVDTVAITPPAPDLVDASDSGSSNSDNVTRFSPLSFNVASEAGTATFTVDGSSIGSMSVGFDSSVTFVASSLTDGVHQFRTSVVDLAGNVSVAGAALAVTVDTAATTPSMPDLSSDRDTGVSSSDNITKSTILHFDGSAEAGSVTLIIDGTSLLPQTTTGMTYSVDAPPASTGAGTHTIAAMVTDLAGNTSSTSSTLTVIVDTTLPTFQTGLFDVDASTQSLRLTFSENVGPTFGKQVVIIVDRDTNAQIPAASMSNGSFDVPSSTGTLTFPGYATGALPDGRYRTLIFGSNITDLAGNAIGGLPTFDFFALAGDASLDRAVTTTDFNILAGNFGQSGRTFTQGDFSYDGVVNTTDFNILAGNFGKSLSLGAPAARAASTTSSPQPTLFSDSLIDRTLDGEPNDAGLLPV